MICPLLLGTAFSGGEGVLIPSLRLTRAVNHVGDMLVVGRFFFLILGSCFH